MNPIRPDSRTKNVSPDSGSTTSTGAAFSRSANAANRAAASPANANPIPPRRTSGRTPPTSPGRRRRCATESRTAASPPPRLARSSTRSDPTRRRRPRHRTRSREQVGVGDTEERTVGVADIAELAVADRLTEQVEVAGDVGSGHVVGDAPPRRWHAWLSSRPATRPMLPLRGQREGERCERRRTTPPTTGSTAAGRSR